MPRSGSQSDRSYIDRYMRRHLVFCMRFYIDRYMNFYIDRYMKVLTAKLCENGQKMMILNKIKICIYRSKNEFFRHISVKKSFLKKFIYRSIFDDIYRSIYSISILTDMCLHIPTKIIFRLHENNQ